MSKKPHHTAPATCHTADEIARVLLATGQASMAHAIGAMAKQRDIAIGERDALSREMLTPTVFQRLLDWLREPKGRPASLAADGRPGASDEMVIDQCSWKIVSSNAAATELSQLQSELSILGTPAKAGGKHRVYHWTQDLFQRVARAYESGPELMVEFGEWPAYRLRIGRHASQSHRRHAENVVTGVNRLHTVQPASSVFDTHYLCFSPAIGRTVAKGVHPKARLEQSQSRVKAAGKEGGMFSGLDQLAMDHQKSTLKQDVAEFEARPDGWDWVELSYDTWVLEKAR